jgi:hypothetical protein
MLSALSTTHPPIRMVHDTVLGSSRCWVIDSLSVFRRPLCCFLLMSISFTSNTVVIQGFASYIATSHIDSLVLLYSYRYLAQLNPKSEQCHLPFPIESSFLTWLCQVLNSLVKHSIFCGPPTSPSFFLMFCVFVSMICSQWSLPDYDMTL